MGKIDGDTRFVGGEYGPKEEVDHGASARENLREVGRDLKEAVTPDKLAGAIAMIRGGGRHDSLIGIEKALGVLALPWAAAADLAEIALKPLAAVKDAGDAAIHGILAGVKGKG